MKKLHIGIILDGNRRFAKRLMKNPWDGHEEGAKRVEDLLNWGQELKEINQLTLYCFSLENFKRDKEEVDFLMNILKREFKRFEDDKRIRENKVKIRFIGKRELLDKEIQELMNRIEKKTEKYNNYVINFAVAYGGRQEIISAIKKLVEKKEEINEENLQKNLWLSSEPDLIVRTGGVKRTSNFLPWQSIYSEWIFLDKMWPEMTKQDMLDALEEFKSRERRFGK